MSRRRVSGRVAAWRLVIGSAGVSPASCSKEKSRAGSPRSAERSGSDHRFGAEVGDGCFVVAEFGEDGVGVLAEGGGPVAQVGGGFGEGEGDPGDRRGGRETGVVGG